jgi:hypothetical protein
MNETPTATARAGRAGMVCVLDREGRLDVRGELPVARTLPDAVRHVLGVRA